jgi:1-deoxy-D-xylulose-5-phosphate synthase
LAFEALNQLCGCTLPILVVVNDNQMSIDPNVGGISTHLRHLKSKNASDRASSFFETLGIPYTGCIDGHNLEELIGALRSWDSNPRTGIIHVSTRKGKGYPLAEQEQIRWHAPGRFPNLCVQDLNFRTYSVSPYWNWRGPTIGLWE